MKLIDFLNLALVLLYSTVFIIIILVQYILIRVVYVLLRRFVCPKNSFHSQSIIFCRAAGSLDCESYSSRSSKYAILFYRYYLYPHFYAFKMCITLYYILYIRKCEFFLNSIDVQRNFQKEARTTCSRYSLRSGESCPRRDNWRGKYIRIF